MKGDIHIGVRWATSSSTYKDIRQEEDSREKNVRKSQKTKRKG
jgi:hypothetical protein